MRQVRRSLHARNIACAAAGLLLGLFATLALGQTYPNRAIRLIVDTSPGGLTDILGRMAAEGLTQQFGRQILVENKAGAAGNVAVEFLMKSPADGYTLLIAAGGNLVVKPFLERSLPFEQGDLQGRGHFERGFRHQRPDAKKGLA